VRRAQERRVDSGGDATHHCNSACRDGCVNRSSRGAERDGIELYDVHLTCSTANRHTRERASGGRQPDGKARERDAAERQIAAAIVKERIHGEVDELDVEPTAFETLRYPLRRGAIRRSARAMEPFLRVRLDVLEQSGAAHRSTHIAAR
jgi:hypothetical protein